MGVSSLALIGVSSLHIGVAFARPFPEAAPIARISASVPDTARTKLASWETEPRRDGPPLAVEAVDAVRAMEAARATEAVRVMEAVRVINGPSCPTTEARLASGWSSAGMYSPVDDVREKGTGLRLLRLAMPCTGRIDGTGILLWMCCCSGLYCLGLGVFALIPRVVVRL